MNEAAAGGVGKYISLDPDAGSSHSQVMALVPPGARVLEFGCATGYVSRVLTERLGCAVTGVELFPAAAERARPHCRRVIVGDAETMDLQRVFEGEKFDAVLFGDVLEHLRDPGALLERVRFLVDEGGAVVASIPNIAHGSVRLALLHGEFRYRPTGLLDNTHLRFFTRQGVSDLFESAGYHITHWHRTRRGIDETEVAVPQGRLTELVREWLARDPEATTYQFVVRAVPSEAARLLHHTRGQLAAAEAELRQLRAERVSATARDLAELIPADETVVLIDQAELPPDLTGGRRVVPFPENGGQYWGPPADADAAIGELERLRRAGAGYVAVAWPAFWWLTYYAKFAEHLRSRYRRLRENERVIIFDVRQAEVGGGIAQGS